ncbi:YopX family protein [Listeria kieliensis]
MREIEFRGMSTIDEAEMSERWIKHHGKWVHGTPIENYIISGVVEATEEYICIECWCPVIPETISQYTGLKDRNSKKIFEGDIVQIDYGFGGKNAEIYYSEDKGWSAGVRTLNGMQHCLKVIGNKWENPELLEEVMKNESTSNNRQRL